MPTLSPTVLVTWVTKTKILSAGWLTNKQTFIYRSSGGWEACSMPADSVSPACIPHGDRG